MPQLAPPSLSFLARHYCDTTEEVQAAARALLEGALQRMTPQMRQRVIEAWTPRLVPPPHHPPQPTPPKAAAAPEEEEAPAPAPAPKKPAAPPKKRGRAPKAAEPAPAPAPPPKKPAAKKRKAAEPPEAPKEPATKAKQRKAEPETTLQPPDDSVRIVFTNYEPSISERGILKLLGFSEVGARDATHVITKAPL